MRPRTVAAYVVAVALLVGSPDSVRAAPAAPAASAAPTFCSEPAGQTDTPPHPRLVRALVGGVPVAVVLPVGYHSSDRRYPVLHLLHGAQGDEDSWIEYGGLLDTTARQRPVDRAVVVMPRMGAITGLAVDWVDGFRRDATWMARTLVRWTDRHFRTRADRRHRAIAGYSGGGLSATHVAQRFPGTFGQLGAFSAPLDLSGPANRLAAWGAFETEKLCAGDDAAAAGPLGNPLTRPGAWDRFDPLAQVDRLSRTLVWVSSGNGTPCGPADAADLVYPTAATEPQMRTQADAFVAALTSAGIDHIEQRRPCGLHWWSTWRPALADFWQVAAREWRRS